MSRGNISSETQTFGNLEFLFDNSINHLDIPGGSIIDINFAVKNQLLKIDSNIKRGLKTEATKKS